MAATECSICIETFNKSTRKPVKCPFCPMTACRTCVQTALLGMNQPVCMDPDCKKPWSEDFLGEFSVKTWLNGEYKNHRGKILMDIEKARLPETQEFARNYQTAKKLLDEDDNRISELKKQKEALPEEQERKRMQDRINELWKEVTKATTVETRQQAYDNVVKARKEYYNHIGSKQYIKAVHPLKNKIKEICGTQEYRRVAELIRNYGVPVVRGAVAGAGAGGPVAGAPPEEPKKNWEFVMKCPLASCEGFIGLNYICGLCDAKICKDCHEPCHDPASTNTAHTCDADKILSIRAIAKEAKPCPKCAALISKIDGCDQMWCTQCHVAFSWRTGAVEHSVHNPHYYEWMRRNGRVPVPLVAGAECAVTPEDILNQAMFSQHCRAHVEISNFVQNFSHCRQVLRWEYQQSLRYREGHSETTKRKYRVQRLVGEFNDTTWAKHLSTDEKSLLKLRCVGDIYEMYVTAGTDILREALNAANNKDEICQQLRALVDYTNLQIKASRTRFKDYNIELVGPAVIPAPTPAAVPT